MRSCELNGDDTAANRSIGHATEKQGRDLIRHVENCYEKEDKGQELTHIELQWKR